MEVVASDRGLRRRPWFPAVRRIGGELGSRASYGQFTVGTGAHEPWHLTAHLQDAARWAGASFEPPVLARRRVPSGAPAHLAIAIDDVVRENPRCNLLVVAPEAPDAELLERLSDVRRGGGTVFALAGAAHGASADLLHVVHDLAVVDEVDFEVAQHVLPATLDEATSRARRHFFFSGPRAVLGRL